MTSDQRERVALALLNAQRDEMALPPVEDVRECHSPDLYRRLADAALKTLALDEQQARET